MLYPMKFRPDFHPTVWGGRRLKQFKGQISMGEVIGESWEISVVSGYISVIANGAMRGLRLTDAIREDAEGLLGRKVIERYGSTFPLLIKFIDADKDLSIQVHPDDEAALQRHNSMGKTEMWYVIDTRPDARITVGFKEPLTAEQFVAKIKDNTIASSLSSYSAKAGDVFFLPAGRVHAIGAGCMVAEVQENSDITYRIYDYDRIGLDGRKRELHVEAALSVIDYSVEQDYRTHYEPKANAPVPLVSCSHFHTTLYDAEQELHINISENESFSVIMCLDGIMSLADANGSKIILRRGETSLIPSSSSAIDISPKPWAKFLEVHC